MTRILDADSKNNDLASFVERIENVNEEYVQWQMKHAADGKRFAEDRREIIDEAKEAGVNVKALRAVVKARALERKAEEARDALEDDEQQAFDDIREALGDFADSPLGAAAVEKATPKQDATTSAVVSAVKGSMTDEEWNSAGGAIQ